MSNIAFLDAEILRREQELSGLRLAREILSGAPSPASNQKTVRLLPAPVKKPAPKMNERLTKARDLKDKGRSFEAIGRELKVTGQTVANWLKKDPRDVTGQLMGDPAPGRSALEGRRA